MLRNPHYHYSMSIHVNSITRVFYIKSNNTSLILAKDFDLEEIFNSTFVFPSS